MSAAIASGDVAAIHDVSDGGIAVAAAEMCIASGLGMMVQSDDLGFEERSGQYLVELRGSVDRLREKFAGVAEVIEFGRVEKSAIFKGIPVQELTAVWRGTLDW
jgi:phosphoribosylformylglycinamidine (FGAM) synthase-like enzyme